MAYQPIIAETSQLILDRYHSNLSAIATLGSNTFTLYSISQFSVNQVLGIGEPGNAGSEIILTHATSVPAGSTVYLASNLLKTHAKDTPVYILSVDQIEFYHSDTVTGAKTQLGSTQYIDFGKEQMIYDDTLNTTGYYFTRFKNSISGNFSDYSDPVPYEGFEQNTVGYAINAALSETGAELGSVITYFKLISWANQMLRLVRGKKKVWSEYQEFGYTVDTMVQLSESYAMPSTIYDNNSNKSVLNVMVDGYLPLDYIDRSEYIQLTAKADANAAIEIPELYSIWDGNIYLWPRGNDDIEGEDLLMDFYTDIDKVDSDSDVIHGPRFDMLIHYLKFKIRGVVDNNSREDLNDPSYIQYGEILRDAMKLEESGQINTFRPRGSAVSGGRARGRR